MRVMSLLMLALVLPGLCVGAQADGQAPWGHAVSLEINYQPRKVLYDVDTGSPEKLANILDRVSLLNRYYGADPFDGRIVLVLHGESIPFFAIDNLLEYEELMTRARSLTLGDTVEFRMCRTAAKGRYGLEAKDIHGFVKMVPMADAEIVRLQADEGFTYMR